MKQDTIAELAMRRRLTMLVLLYARPQTRDELIEELWRQELFSIDREETPEAIVRRREYQFQADLKALRLAESIIFDQASKCYTWKNPPFKLALDEELCQALALLYDTFEYSSLPYTPAIRRLLARIAALLTPERQKNWQQKKPGFKIRLQEATNYQTIDTAMIRTLEQAVRNKQQIAFRYRPSYDEKETRHRVEPQKLDFQDGHVYFYGWSLEWQREFKFRVDTIDPNSIEPLAIQNVPGRPSGRVYMLRYRLLAPIARHHVSEHFVGHKPERHDDGSVTITASTTDLFAARRILLSYGENCIIESPPELIERMRAVRDHYCKVYPNAET